MLHVPAGDFCECRRVSCQSCVRAASVAVRGAAIMVGITEVSVLVANHLQWLTQLNQCRRQTCQADHSEKKKNIIEENTDILHDNIHSSKQGI